MKFSVKQILHFVGSILAVLAIFFVIARLHSYLNEVDFSAVLVKSLVPLAVMSLLYGVSGLFLVKIWCRSLDYLDVQVNFKSATWIYGCSQLAKYIPGNIFHLAGRQALCMAENFPAGKTMKSLAFELGIQAIGAAGIFCPVFLAYFLFPFESTGSTGTTGATGASSGIFVCLFVCLFILCCVTVPWLAGRLLGEKIRAAFLWCLAYLSVMAAVFVVLLLQVTVHPLNFGDVFILAVGYVVAWFVGLVTPGAPAGMGMREATMLLLAKGMPVPEVDLLLAVVLCRIVTTSGDFIFFLGSLGLKYFIRSTARG